MKASYPVEKRREKLKEFLAVLESNTDKIDAALFADLDKPIFEAQLSETFYVIREIKHFIKNMRYWAKPKSVFPSLLNFPSSDYISPIPYGKVLIFSPWNYPFQLAISPMIAAYASGNTICLKPSELAPKTSQIIQVLIEKVFDKSEVEVIQGDHLIANELLQKKWNYIFFTGGTEVGRIVAKAAAENLTPCTLELGGKNPTVVLADADVSLTAKRLVWGKFFNCGQTCIAPDFLLADEKIAEELQLKLVHEIRSAYGENPKLSPDYGRIIDTKKTSRLQNLLETTDLNWKFGGESEVNECYFSPTIIRVNSLESDIMKEEIFGPILPIITYKTSEERQQILSKYTHSLAFYIFGKDKKTIEEIINNQPSGGACINDTVVHFANEKLPFGGIGNSGYGAYHGKFGFDTFTHRKSVVKRGTWLDISLRYAPYKGKISLLKKFLKWL